jgi:diguanylate cyclase (GGDEF)-like protein
MNRDILIIEGSSNARETIRAALESAGHGVREAVDGKTGVAQMRQQLPDLVILDLWLPDINGFDLVAQLRALAGSANIPMLALTGFVAKGDELRIVAAQFTDYLFKPVEIPLLLQTVRTHLEPALNDQEVLGNNRRVLVIDDEPAQLKLLAVHLRRLGFVVATATNGIAGLAQAREFHPAVIASDILMPGMDGFQLCMEVRADAELRATPIVLLSNNYAQEADRQLALRMGASALVQTTPDFHDAVRAIVESLDAPPPAPSTEAYSLHEDHQKRMARQLERQAQLNYELARRCAAQKAQLSVLTQMGETFLNGTVNRAALHTELIAQYVDVTGFSQGAILLADGDQRLIVSANVGFSDAVVKTLPRWFAHDGRLRAAMLQGEPVCLTAAPGGDEATNQLLTSLNAESAIISPLRSDADELGVIILTSQTPVLDSEWLSFSKAVTNQIAQVIALNQAITRLNYIGSHDPLTQLPNRASLQEQLHHRSAAGRRITLFLLNLDHFQEINNALTYRNGNVLLGQVAARLQASLPAEAVVARLGADEFAVLRDDIASMEDLHRHARDILKSLEPTFKLAGLPIALRATMGIAFMPPPGEDADTVLSYADMARRAARRTGHDYLVYPENVEPYVPDHLALLGELREAIENNDLVLHYQPKVSFKTGKAVGVEALLRWHHPIRGLIAPDRFIPLAERAGLIHPLTLWVVEAALRQGRDWRNAGTQLGIAINISAHDLQDPRFADLVTQLCAGTGTPHRDVTFELTERSLMTDTARAKGTLLQLSKMGVGLSIDDFGTGYSALAYLQSLPVNEIKIDKSFIANFVADQRARRIVHAIIDLGQSLGVGVVAEGIETREAWDVLNNLGCDMGQGYYIGRPMVANQLSHWLKQSPLQISLSPEPLSNPRCEPKPQPQIP